MANGFTASYSGAKASNKAYQILNSAQGLKLNLAFNPTIASVTGAGAQGETNPNIPVEFREAPLIYQIPDNLRSGVSPDSDYDSLFSEGRFGTTQAGILGGSSTLLLLLGAGVILFLVYGNK